MVSRNTVLSPVMNRNSVLGLLLKIRLYATENVLLDEDPGTYEP